MSVNSQTYLFFNGNGTVSQARLTFTNVSQFLRDMVRGTITGYETANFFQTNSEYVVNVKYYPIYLDSFIDSEITVDNVIRVGKSGITGYSSHGIVSWKKNVKIVNNQ